MEDLAVEVAPLAFASYCAALLEAKRSGALPDGGAWQAAGAVKVLDLKGTHRALCEHSDAAREAAGEAKGALDTRSLQLQNLLYERHHYEKEIASCRAWRSAYSDEQIALLPDTEFESHPLAAEKGLAGEEEPHQRMLNRLAHEVAFRQEYVKTLEGIRAQRDALAADVAQKRSTVAGLEGEMSKLLAAARGVQQQYSIRLPDAGGKPEGGEGGAQGNGEPEVDSPAAAAAAAARAAAGGAAEAAAPPPDVAMQDA